MSWGIDLSGSVGLKLPFKLHSMSNEIEPKLDKVSQQTVSNFQVMMIK